MEPTVPKLHTPEGQRAHSLQSHLSMESQRNGQELHRENKSLVFVSQYAPQKVKQCGNYQGEREEKREGPSEI